MKHKHVLFDTTALETGHAARGIGTYTRELAAAFDSISIPGLSIHTQRKSLRKRTVDLIHMPFFDLYRASLRPSFKSKLVVTIHDVIPLVFPEEYPVGKKGTIAHHWQKFMLRFVHHVVTDSNASKQDIHDLLGVPTSKISVIYLGANKDLAKVSQEQSEELLRELKIPKQYILYVGDINYNKNIPQLIKALKHLPSSLHLVLLGKNFKPAPIPEWEAIEQQIALSNVQERVHFLPSIPTGDTDSLAKLYSNAVCYVQPSLYEGFGLPVLEAMRCKTPVVAAATSSLPEVAGTHALFSQPTGEKLAEKISEVLSWTKPQRQTFVTAAHEWSLLFNWEASAKQLAQLYADLLNIPHEKD